MAFDVKTVSLSLSDIPRIFNIDSTSELCARDIIAYVRGNFEPNPWVRVILDVKGKVHPVALEELATFEIYWKGFNDKDLVDNMGISIHSYCVIKAGQLSDSDDSTDCGLTDLLSEYRQKYNIMSFDVLVSGSATNERDVRVLHKLKEYSFAVGRDDIVFPVFIVRQNQLRENGLDISPYAKEIDLRRVRNTLDYTYLEGVLKELSTKIVSGSTEIQDLRSYRTKDVKLLTTYFVLKYGLPPLYIFSFLEEYRRFEFFYPRTKLSLYERVRFLSGLPQLIGYIGDNIYFSCLAKVIRKIFPSPHYVFDLESRSLVSDTSQFALTSAGLKLLDFRSMFSDSKSVVPLKGSMSPVPVQNDAATDKALVDMFDMLSALVTEEEIYISIKNSLLAVRDGRRYLLYCPEECGLQVVFFSELFNTYETILSEEHFKDIIDAQIVRALSQRERAAGLVNDEAGNKALVLAWQKIDPRLAIKPAIPLETNLYMQMLPVDQNGLSYYDTRLRCHLNILPIVTTIGSSLRDVSPLFDEISLNNLRRDPQARAAINCFGTLSEYNPQNPVLPITYYAFRQRGLLL